MAVLQFYKHSELLFEHPLRSSSLTIGRSDRCDVALPGELISRTHLVLHRRGANWVLRDCSKHGVLVDGNPLEEKKLLQGGEWISVGAYRLRISKEIRQLEETHEEPTSAVDIIVASSEEIVSIKALIKVIEGTDKGEAFELSAKKNTVGRGEDAIALSDPSVVSNHAQFIVSRGRVMVSALNGPVFLDGLSVHDLTPVFPGECVRLGDTVLEVQQKQRSEQASSLGFGRLG